LQFVLHKFVEWLHLRPAIGKAWVHFLSRKKRGHAMLAAVADWAGASGLLKFEAVHIGVRSASVMASGLYR
jgi:hypothetical protein